MKSTYLINKGYYIKDDLESLLLYYDFFSQGLALPKKINTSIIKRLAHFALRQLIIILYATRLYAFLYKKVILEDDAIIIIQGKGTWGSIVKLIKRDRELKIIKKVKNNELFLKEKQFYEKYKKNNSNIILPESIFLKENTIVMKFIKAKSFQRLMNEGLINFNETILRFGDLSNEFRKFYCSQHTLIHGDLNPINILVKDERYYIIDFTDTHRNDYEYDLYSLFYYILCTFKLVDIHEKTIANFLAKNKHMMKIINIKLNSLYRIEKEFVAYRTKRFPDFF